MLTLCLAAFDYDYGVLEDAEQSTLAKAYHGILYASVLSSRVDCLQRSGCIYSKDAEFRLPGAMMLFRAAWDYIPVPVLKLFQYLPVDPFTRILSLRRLYISVGKQILREKRPELDAEKRPNSKDIMSILSMYRLSQRIPQSADATIATVKANASSEAKTRLNDDELMAEMYTLTLAGHETTATTISFLMYQLSLHPEYQARMRQEIREVRARVSARTGIDFTMEDLDNMPLCLNAIKVCIAMCSKKAAVMFIVIISAGNAPLPPYRLLPPPCCVQGRRASAHAPYHLHQRRDHHRDPDQQGPDYHHLVRRVQSVSSPLLCTPFL